MQALEKGKLGPVAEPEWDTRKFFRSLGLWYGATRPGWPAVATAVKFKQYLGNEEGTVPPIRSGHERILYQMIKGRLVKGGPLLTPEAVLAMAAVAVRDPDGKANLPLAFLTAHNVVRALARPGQWRDVTYPRSDPMYDVFADLRGLASTDAMDPLPVEMGKKRYGVKIPRDVSRPGALDPQWMSIFFKPGGSLQRFSALPGTEGAIDNGGSNYYFWVGAISYAVLGKSPTELGIGMEIKAKREGSQEEQRLASIEPPNAYRGMVIARCLEQYVRRPHPEPATSGKNPNAAAGVQSVWLLQEVKINPDGIPLRYATEPGDPHPSLQEFLELARGKATIHNRYSFAGKTYDCVVAWTWTIPRVLVRWRHGNWMTITGKIKQGSPGAAGTTPTVHCPWVSWVAGKPFDDLKQAWGKSLIAFGTGYYVVPNYLDDGDFAENGGRPNNAPPSASLIEECKIRVFSSVGSMQGYASKPIAVYVYKKGELTRQEIEMLQGRKQRK